MILRFLTPRRCLKEQQQPRYPRWKFQRTGTTREHPVRYRFETSLLLIPVPHRLPAVHPVPVFRSRLPVDRSRVGSILQLAGQVQTGRVEYSPSERPLRTLLSILSPANQVLPVLKPRIHHPLQTALRREAIQSRERLVQKARKQLPLLPNRSEEHTSELQSRENLVC